jgi:small subunit ribosomal protein S12e
MSEAGDDIQVDAPAAEVEVEATPDTAPKGKLSVEEALQVRNDLVLHTGAFLILCSYSKF